MLSRIVGTTETQATEGIASNNNVACPTTPIPVRLHAISLLDLD